LIWVIIYNLNALIICGDDVVFDWIEVTIWIGYEFGGSSFIHILNFEFSPYTPHTLFLSTRHFHLLLFLLINTCHNKSHSNEFSPPIAALAKPCVSAILLYISTWSPMPSPCFSCAATGASLCFPSSSSSALISWWWTIPARIQEDHHHW